MILPGQDAAVLNQAYSALREKRYEEAIALFRKSIGPGPATAALHKDLAYTYLKTGDSEAARDEFRRAMELDPQDHHAALEYAFLCFETRQQAEARRVFDRVRAAGDEASRQTAEQAFQNIDVPLGAGIERWTMALQRQPDDFSAHQELAALADQRDEWELAARHYRRAWELKPERRGLLVHLGRILKSLGRTDEATAALLAASRGGEPHAAEAARELLPVRYPYVYEFESALALDPASVELRREFAYLLLRMGRQPEAETHFRIITERAPEDLLSAAQLGFLVLTHNDVDGATPLLQRVLKGSDEDLANRVRAVLRMPQVLRKRTDARAGSIEAKLMAERSWKAGYLKDAQKYLFLAHEADPVDFSVMLRLGWVHNLLNQDAEARRWFNLARRSPDPAVSREAAKASGVLRASLSPFRTTAWMMPVYSSRWRDAFGYGQIKTEWKLPFPVHPYLSMRLAGDEHVGIEGARAPQLIFGTGVATATRYGVTGWAEAGFRRARWADGHRWKPDYRAGVAVARRAGAAISGESPGWAVDLNFDGVFLSQFDNDVLGVVQSRAGYVFGPGQVVWNWNLTTDTNKAYWANVMETGPGLRLRFNAMPRGSLLSVDVLKGTHLRNDEAYSGWTKGGNRPEYIDVRAGFWYAFTY
jgi:Tfp pilus assembly protein PilF